MIWKSWHITEKWLVKSSESLYIIAIAESLMKLVSSNFSIYDNVKKNVDVGPVGV